jgi:hypothetical protein
VLRGCRRGDRRRCCAPIPTLRASIWTPQRHRRSYASRSTRTARARSASAPPTYRADRRCLHQWHVAVQPSRGQRTHRHRIARPARRAPAPGTDRQPQRANAERHQRIPLSQVAKIEYEFRRRHSVATRPRADHHRARRHLRRHSTSGSSGDARARTSKLSASRCRAATADSAVRSTSPARARTA